MKIKKIIVLFFAVLVVGFGVVSITNAVHASSVVPQITRDLTIGSTGNDVKALQQFLNYSGYTVAISGSGSAGFETTTFGSLTKAALAKFQAAKGLSATGILDSTTRAFMEQMAGRTTSTTTSTETTTTSTGVSTATLSSEIDALEAQIASLQSQIDSLTARLSAVEALNDDDSDDEDSDSDLSVSSIRVSDGGEEGYIDTGDIITITFSEAVDPESINEDLEIDESVTGVSKSEVGGVTISSTGKITIDSIATFDLGSVDDSGDFTVKLTLNSTGKVLTITLTSGSDIEITNEDFSSATQVGGTVTNEDGDEMASDSSLDDPTGTFGGENSSSSEGLVISSIEVSDGGEEGYIDEGDTIEITFSEAVDPTSINDDLEEGDEVDSVEYSEVGGVSVSSAGKVTIKGIATFDMGSIEDSGNFDVELALNSTSKVLTITLADGDELEISEEDFSSATQTGGTIENEDGDEMESDSSISDPSGSFGGSSDSDSDDEDGPSIASVSVADGEDTGDLSAGDEIFITFNEAIDPESIDSDLIAGSYVVDVDSDSIGGVTIDDDGILTVTDILSFDVGDVDDSTEFVTKVILSSSAKILSILLTSGEAIDIEEDFSGAEQIGGTVEDDDGNEMNDSSSLNDPTGTFGDND